MIVVTWLGATLIMQREGKLFKMCEQKHEESGELFGIRDEENKQTYRVKKSQPQLTSLVKLSYHKRHFCVCPGAFSLPPQPVLTVR